MLIGMQALPARTADRLPEPVNGVYTIRDTVDLQGLTARLEPGTTLKFEGGYIDNGILLGDSTKVEAAATAFVFSPQLRLGGTWAVRAARPEWFGARGDGIAYYEKPLRCYNGTVGDTVVEKSASRVRVEHPSSRIVFTDHWNCAPEHTTSQVVYSPTRHCFLLHEQGKYYNRWANSAEWNDPKSGKARGDVLFSDISTRQTTFSDHGTMKDIDSTMTDDSKAITRAIRMGGGNVLLRPVVYYFKIAAGRPEHSTPWRQLSHFVFDGHGATLFLRTAYEGRPDRYDQSYFAWIYHCSDGVFRNLRIMSLRDRDDGAPHGHRRYSSSDSRCVAFGVFGCKRLKFEHITLKSMSHDFILKADFGMSEDINIDRWYSRDFTQNAFGGVRRCHVNKADLEQADLIGDGMHVIYGQTMLRQFYLRDSRFAIGGNHTSVMLTYHGGHKDAYPDSIYYDNCTIEGARMVQGGAFQHQTFRRCTFRKTYDGFLTSKGKMERNRYAVIGSGIHLAFEGCLFDLKDNSLVLSTGSTKLTLSLDRCKIYSPQATHALIYRQGKVRINRCDIRCKNHLMYTGGKPEDTVDINGCSIECKMPVVQRGKTPAENIRMSGNSVKAVAETKQ